MKPAFVDLAERTGEDGLARLERLAAERVDEVRIGAGALG